MTRGDGQIPTSLDGVRVDKAVALVADLSRSAVNALIDEGRIRIDGSAVRSRSTAAAPAARSCGRPGPGPAPGAPRAGPCGGLRGGPRGRRPHRGGQAGRAGGPSRCRSPPGTLVNGLLARFPDLECARPRRSAPTPTARDRPPARPGHLGPAGGGPDPGLRTTPSSPSCEPAPGGPGLPGAGARHGWRAAPGWSTPRSAGRSSSPDPDGGVPEGQGGPDPLPRGAPVHPAGPDHPADGHAGDRPDPPDPGPPGAIGHPVVGDEAYGHGRIAPRRRGGPAVPARRSQPRAFDHPRTGRQTGPGRQNCPTTSGVQLER